MKEMDATVVTALRELWPGSSVVGADGGESRGPVRARYAIVSHGREARMLVPLGSVGTRAPSALRLQSLLARDRVEVRGGADGLDARLSDMFGTRVQLSIDLAATQVPAGPVLHVFDRSGRALAVVKVGTTPEAARAVRAQEEALARLDEHHFTQILVPRLIFTGAWRDQPLVAIDALPSTSWRVIAPWDAPVAAMEELASAFSHPDGPLDSSPWWQRQWDAVAHLDPVARGRLGRCLERIVRLADERFVTWGAWHGDWTPRTMARHRGRVALWDWTYFEPDAPRGLDRLHFLASPTVDRQSDDPDALLAAMNQADRETPDGGSTAHLRGLLYLVAMATRYAGLVERSGVSRLASRAEATIVALEKLSGELREN